MNILCEVGRALFCRDLAADVPLFRYKRIGYKQDEV